MLNPEIATDKLDLYYGYMAETLLKLTQLSLPCVGSLGRTGQDDYPVTQRPMTMNMNGLVQLGGV